MRSRLLGILGPDKTTGLADCIKTPLKKAGAGHRVDRQSNWWRHGVCLIYLWHVTAEGAFQIEASGGPDCSHIAGRNLGRNNRMGCGAGASQPCPSTGASAYSTTAGSSSSTAGYTATS